MLFCARCRRVGSILEFVLSACTGGAGWYQCDIVIIPIEYLYLIWDLL